MEHTFLTEIVDGCTHVFEETSFLEIHRYKNSQNDLIREGKLERDDFDAFQAIQGQFRTSCNPEGAEGVQKIASLRLIVQADVKHPEAFAPDTLQIFICHHALLR
ncbi:hypothetical protein JMJ35_006973 [Cladonia borealis]|uniref:Uncharacterized protein n=1 Tax=Cladonia borealis TaxID=184061 RepID=A0AA39QY19_9LECA|nr:hypothetical protein JMJ35_006973 [Cladonia borealis]